MKAVIFVYVIMMMLVLGVALAPARAQIMIAPPHVEFGDHHWRHDYHPYRYEDGDHDRYWHHRHWRHHHHDDDED